MNFLEKLFKLLTPIPNEGVKPEQIKDTDWISGKETGIVYEQISDKWEDYLPKAELQRELFETYSCVSFTLNNVVETLLNKYIASEKLSKKALYYLNEKGYIVNKQVNFSDAYQAIGSGTTKEGNSGSNVCDFTRHNGFIPEAMLPVRGKNTYDYLYNTKITPEMYALGKVFFDRIGYELAYEWVLIKDGRKAMDTLKTHLKQCPLQVFTPLCPDFMKGKNVKTCSTNVLKHSYMIYNIDDIEKLYNAFDQYEPFKKTLNKDYPIPYALKIALIPIKMPDKPIYEWKTSLRQGDSGNDVKALQEALVYEGLLNKNLTTGYFGVNTKNAVIDFQNIHREEILYPVGLKDGTGLVGKSTINYLNKIYK